MGVSVIEYAKMRGISDARVYQLKKQGLLTFDVDGKIDAEATNAVLDARPRNYRTGPKRDAKPDVTPDAKADSLEDRAKALVASRPQLTHAEAVTKKENYLAALRELEYDLASGNVVEIAGVIKQIGQALASVRSRMIAIPPKVAPRAAIMADAEEIRGLIEAEIIEALEELTFDAGNGVQIRSGGGTIPAGVAEDHIGGFEAAAGPDAQPVGQ